MFKNVASQKLVVYAYDTSADTPKTGDAANITMQISKDGAACAASNDTNPTELDSTDAKGVYIFDLLQAESNCDLFIGSPVSSTSNIVIEPVIVYTTTPMRGTDSAALASVCTETRLAELDAANLPADVDAIPTTAMRGTDSAALASVCTETRLAELDAANLPADVDWLKAVAEGDTYVDKTPTPWQLVVHKKGDSGTEYVRKDLKDVDGNNIAATTTVIGRHEEPA